MKILVADKLDASCVKALEEIGEVAVKVGLKPEEMAGILSEFTVLIVRSTKVPRATIEAGSKGSLKLIIRAGIGYDTIDIDAATEFGVFVSNCPGTNSHAVVELVIGHLINCDRGIVQSTVKLQKGEWCKTQFQTGLGLWGRTLGIVGTGFIGRLVAKAAIGLGMKIIGFDVYVSKEVMESAGIEKVETLDELLARSDAITLHTVLTKETFHMFNKELFAKMKKGAILINASRGEVIDSEALVEASKTNGIKAALDVYEDEPEPQDKIFKQVELANSLISATPHIGASTIQASEAVGEYAVEIVREFAKTGKPIPMSVVNKKLL